MDGSGLGPFAAPHRQRGRRAGLVIGIFGGLFALGLVIGLVLGGFSVAGAKSGSSSPSSSPSTHSPGVWPGMHHFGPGLWPFFGRFFQPGAGPGPGIGGPGGAVHGQLTFPGPGGGSRTIDIQTGSVSSRPSASSSSITVKSSDGFTKTYTVDDATLVVAGGDGIADVQQNDTVVVLAEEGSGSSHAVRVIDLTALGKVRGGTPFGGGFPGFPAAFGL